MQAELEIKREGKAQLKAIEDERETCAIEAYKEQSEKWRLVRS